jgi:hypothetical protein
MSKVECCSRAKSGVGQRCGVGAMIWSRRVIWERTSANQCGKNIANQDDEIPPRTKRGTRTPRHETYLALKNASAVGDVEGIVERVRNGSEPVSVDGQQNIRRGDGELMHTMNREHLRRKVRRRTPRALYQTGRWWHI